MSGAGSARAKHGTASARYARRNAGISAPLRLPRNLCTTCACGKQRGARRPEPPRTACMRHSLTPLRVGGRVQRHSRPARFARPGQTCKPARPPPFRAHVRRIFACAPSPTQRQTSSAAESVSADRPIHSRAISHKWPRRCACGRHSMLRGGRARRGRAAQRSAARLYDVPLASARACDGGSRRRGHRESGASSSARACRRRSGT